MSSISESLSLKMGFFPQHHHITKQLSFQIQEQESASTQSPGQSYPEYGSAKSVCSGTQGKAADGLIKFMMSKDSQDFPFSLSQPSQQSHMHPAQSLSMAPLGEVPLSLQLTEATKCVNAKLSRANAILKRRQYRAKLEAQRKQIKVRKPYIHESRHLHAMKRARGTGGRFLNTKKLQEELKPNVTDHEGDVPCCVGLNIRKDLVASEIIKLNNYMEGVSTTSCSDMTSASISDDIFLHQRADFRFSGLFSHVGKSMQDGSVDIHAGRNQRHLYVHL